MHPDSSQARLTAARARAVEAIANARDGKATIDVAALERLVAVTEHLNMGEGDPAKDPHARSAAQR